jgi:biopolymer transport protein ExbD
MRVRAHPIRKGRIEIVPLIDIMFFLLATFIMVSLSMTKNQGMQVQLPGASTSQAHEDQNKSITLTVTEKGDIFYNKEKVTMAQLPFKLQTLKASEKDPKVIVNGDAKVDFRLVATVLDEVRKIGVTKIGISTDKR